MRSLTRLILLISTLGLAAGCVSQTVHQQQLDENAHLKQIIQGLETDYENLSTEKKQLIGRNDDLNNRLLEAIERSGILQADLARARADLSRIEKVLADRSAEAGAAMSEMRKTIDRLSDENQAIQQLLEGERQAREEKMAQIQGTYDELVDKLEGEIQRGEVTISELKGKLTVNVVDQILFASGKATLKDDGLKVMQQIGDILKTAVDKEIQVEGHTDNVPIRGRLTETFPSNWELSTARATTVLHFLQDTVGISGNRLSAVGYGEYRPVSSNSTPEGRTQNRRIQIILVPQQQ